MRRSIATILAAAGLAACTVTPAAGPRYFTAPGRTRPLPLSDAVRVSDLLFISGQLGVDAALAQPRPSRCEAT